MLIRPKKAKTAIHDYKHSGSHFLTVGLQGIAWYQRGIKGFLQVPTQEI